MMCLASLWRAVLIACVAALCGCTSTQEPAYPTQLQMIIAQSAHSQVPVEPATSGAISVEQLLANVKASANEDNKAKVKSNSSGNEQKTIYGRDSVPAWIFKGESRQQQIGVGALNYSGNDALAKAQALAKTQTLDKAQKPNKFQEITTTQEPIRTVKVQKLAPVNANQRQLQLQYKANELLPHQVQLLMAKKMVTMQQMKVVKLVVGTSTESSTFARAATAQARAKQLIKEFGEQNGIVVEYRPKIGDNIAIVTFQTRGS